VELRLRDPLTGASSSHHHCDLPLNVCVAVRMGLCLTTGEVTASADDAVRLKEKYSQVHPVEIDLKGNYGVSFVWSDGHYADIFHFDALKKISKECSNK
jgi:DUF971 family protein